MIGKTVSHYRITEKLGEGGMGVVYRAHDTSLNRDVAIKVLPESFVSDPERKARFSREARLLATLSAPNIAAIYGLEEAEGKPYLILELVEGQTLAERLKKRHIPLDETLDICRQVAEGMETAHEKGIIHRDLKPANIKITPEGKVKILDFGLAKAFYEQAVAADPSKSPTITDEMTAPGVILGTAAYMSPEQARGKPTDKRTDIWAFGCILYECLTGKRAFEGETVTETLASILKEEPHWDALTASVSPQIAELLRRCLCKDPKERLHDIGDARIEIARAPKEPPRRPAIVAHTSWKLILPVALACLAFGFACAWVLFRTSQPSEPLAVICSQIGVEPAKQLGADWSDGAISATSLAKVEAQRGFKRPSRTAIALSPDGKTLIFAGIGDKGSRLYRRRMDSWSAVPIEGTEGGRDPFFSPDGQWVGFWANNVWRKVAIGGGLPVDLCAAPEVHWGASWGESDFIVFSSFDKIWKVSASGGKAEILIALNKEKGEQGFVLPHVLPASGSVLFSVVSSRNSWTNPQISALILQTKDRKVILEEGADARYSPTGHLLFVRRGELLAAPFDPVRLAVTGAVVPVVSQVMQAMNALNTSLNSYAAQYSLSASGTLAYVPGGPYPDAQRVLAMVDQKGVSRRLTSELKPYYSPRIHPDGKRLAYVTQGKQRDIFVYDIARDTHRRVMLDGGSILWPIWIPPDGRRLVIVDNESRRILSLPVDEGGKQLVLYEHGSDASPGSFSPDGSLLAFVESQEGTSNSDIYVINTRKGQAESFHATPYQEMHPAFSPDGRFLAYSSNESGRFEVYVSSYPTTGQHYPITTMGGWGPLWSPDGRRLYYASLDRRKLMAVEVILRPEVSAGKPTMLFDHQGMNIMPGFPVRDFDITADGRYFIFSQSVESEPVGASQISLVFNWFEELKRLVPAGNK